MVFSFRKTPAYGLKVAGSYRVLTHARFFASADDNKIEN